MFYFKGFCCKVSPISFFSFVEMCEIVKSKKLHEKLKNFCGELCVLKKEDGLFLK